MGKNIIDLNKYADRAVEFKIGEKLIRCPELSYGDMARIRAYEDNTEATREEEQDIVLFLLNRNTAKVKFTKKDLDALPAGAINRIYQECVILSRKALNDPN